MHVGLKVGDVVFTLRIDEAEEEKTLTIVKGRVVDEDENGMLEFQWEGNAFKSGKYKRGRVFKTLRALFKYEPRAMHFIRANLKEDGDF